MKKCIYCEKELKNRETKYCSKECQNTYQRTEKVNLWLDGKHDGMRGKTSTAYWIKWYFIRKHGEKCMYCNWGEKNIHTGKVPIELSHKDGNFMNT